ncbi:MAG: GntR family transcriptional regulator [Myxococcota bacterium]
MDQGLFKAVRKQSLPEAIYDQLRTGILSGQMAPGSVLPSERQLAEVLGVNRQAVREALKRLEQARMVSIQQGGQTRVLNFLESAGMDVLSQMLLTPEGGVQPKVLRSVIEMRAALAPDIARLCALRASPAVRAAISEVVKEMESAGDDLPRLQDLSLRLWELLVEGADNVAYRLAYNSLRETYVPVRHVLTTLLSRELKAIKHYVALAAAVRQRSGTRAEEAARELMQRSTEDLLKLVKGLEP